MKRCVWSVCFLLCLTNVAYSQNKRLQARKIRNPKVTYVPARSIKRFPFPAVNFEREGLAKKGDQEQIMERIVYPVINKSSEPIAAIVVTFLPDAPDITVLVLWHGDKFDGVLIKRDAQGHFAADAYKVFFEDPVVH